MNADIAGYPGMPHSLSASQLLEWGVLAVIGLAVLAVIAVLVVAVRTPRQLLDIAAWTMLAAVIGHALVSAPTRASNC